MINKTLKDLVIKEAKNLRKAASQEELRKLNFRSLHPQSSSLCIYGQMTGSCWSGRALELILSCAEGVYKVTPRMGDYLGNSELSGKPYKLPSGFTRNDKYCSPIEKFIALAKRTERDIWNEELIKYLRGEIKILKFK